MGAGDSWGDYETPCPECGGVVEYWFFEADCRGNDSSSGIICKSCQHKFSRASWLAVDGPEMARRARLYWQAQYRAFGPYEFSPYHPDYDFSVAKPVTA